MADRAMIEQRRIELWIWAFQNTQAPTLEDKSTMADMALKEFDARFNSKIAVEKGE